jgi:HlyD family secretion protein
LYSRMKLLRLWIRPAKVLAIAILVVPVLLTGCGTKAEQETFGGIVEAGQYDVIAEASGRISHVMIHEGDSINAGQAIATIDDDMQKLAVSQAESAVELVRIKLEGLRAGPTKAQLKKAQAAAGAARASVNAAKATSDYWSDRVEELKLAPQPPPNDLASAEYQLKVAQQKLYAAKWDYSAALSAYEELKQSAADALLTDPANSETGRAIRAAEEELKQAQAQLELAKLSLDRCAITARAEGICTDLQIQEGDMCAAGARVAQITDYSDLWINIYVPQTKLPEIEAGQKMALVSVAWPDEKISGVIVQVSDTAEYTPKNVETPEEKQATVFKVKISITEGAKYAKPGMSLEATIASN